MAIITVTSHKGGVGKSTTAMHVSAYLARRHGSEAVVLVDTDPNESVLDVAARGSEVGTEGLPFRVAGPEEEVWEEYAVYDSQGRLSGGELEDAARESDLMIVPTTPDYMEIAALVRFLDDLNAVGGGNYRVLLTMVPWYERVYCPGRAELEGAETEDGMKVPLFDGQIEGRKVFKHAAALGMPVYGVRGRAGRRGWEDYKGVGDEIVAELASRGVGV